MTTLRKTCTKCSVAFPLDRFCGDSSRNDGLKPWCRSCCTSATRRYRAANREIVAARGRTYRATHQEQIAAWETENRERRLGNVRRWRATHPEARRVEGRKYRAAHREERRVWCSNRRALERDSSGTHDIRDIRAQYARQKGKCFWGRNVNSECTVSLKDGYHTDHVVPLSKGGSNGPENLMLACPTCNVRKNARSPMDFAGVMF